MYIPPDLCVYKPMLVIEFTLPNSSWSVIKMKGRSVEIQRFNESHKKLSGGCWLWTKTVNRHGYGQFCVGSTINSTRRTSLAHRWAYEWFIGPIPDGRLVCHRCDVRHCVNPKHLWLGTVKANAEDMVQKGRAPDGLTKKDGTPKRIARGKRHGWALHPDSLPRGEDAHWARLTEKDVLEIRSRKYERGLYARLAARYGVTPEMISLIYRRKKWTHL